MADHGSIMEALRAQQHDVAQGKTVDMPVAGWRNPGLVARYRFLDPAEAKKIGGRIRAQFLDLFDQELYGAMDMMIAACQGLYARDGDGELIPLDPDDPVKYDQRCGEFFGWDMGDDARARDVVVRVFKGNPYAIRAHGVLFMEWLADTTREVNESLGER